ncbi:MAG: type II secretion system protein [Xenococcaceae cyanobacterium MO_188.B19]|nr:type II secretion system protein [Xenococcaceae cyanobacterium MO_188.B19]
MWHWNVRKNQGFTLIETLAVAIMVGILAAIAAPNLFGLLTRNRINQALSQIEGAITEAQRQAIRQGKSCTVEIDTTNNAISGNPSNCLLNEREIADSIEIETNLSGTPPSIKFSYKGSSSKAGKIVVSSLGSNLKKCFAISLGLGITRTGEYEPDSSQPNDLSKGKCQSNN